MKTAVTQTSIDAYHSVNLTEQHKDILYALDARGPSCIADLAAYLGWQKSTVSPRMNELRKPEMGLLIFVGKYKSKTTKRASNHYRVK